MTMTVDWFVQLVDSSAFEHPNEVREAVRDWARNEGAMAGRHIVWDDDAPYPATITFAGGWPLPNFTSLLDFIQQTLGETEYMVFAEVRDGAKFDGTMVLHVVTKTLLAEMSGPKMVQELVKQLHAAAEPATVGMISTEKP
jgi:hypothetical protein